MTDLNELLKRVDAIQRLPDPADRQRIRLAAGLTRDEMASQIGVTATAIYQWETGRADPGKATVRRYVDLLDRLRGTAASHGDG